MNTCTGVMVNTGYLVQMVVTVQQRLCVHTDEGLL